MVEKIVVGPINKGLKNDRTAFNIDNDSFPTLINAYQWRGRVKRKRGTDLLGRLQRFFNSTSTAYSTTSTFALSSGLGNLLVNSSWTLQQNGNIVPGSVTIINTTVAQTYTDNSLGVLTGTLGGSGTINYASGTFTITGGAGNSVSASFRYYPDLPVMGLEDFVDPSSAYPFTLAFDTKYSYNINVTTPYDIFDVSFYKNPASSGTYIQKTTWTPTTWNGEDYQQFWTTNYQGALWATNGINVPFDITHIGMQFALPSAVTWLTATTVQFTIAGSPLVIGDFVFVNEVVSGTAGAAATLNFQSGYVTAAASPNFTVTFPNANITNAVYTAGMVQYLTNRSDTTVDCIRWFDGFPVDNSTTPVFQTGKGWVNFMPPLSQAAFSIADLPAAQYYLVGARMIIPFKDRLLFIGPVVQTSVAGSQKYLQDTVIYSQNGTPYYTASFNTDPSLATTVFHEILVPVNQTATATAYWEDQTGFGGFQTAGIDQPILSTSTNEDVLIFGFPTTQVRFIYTGNDVVPFNFFTINSELGTGSTFSTINLDKGVMTRGERGFIICSQVEARRFDLEIPDEVFEISLINNGAERVCAQRDFVNEWVYFTYPVNTVAWKFPNQTLQYNYRDDSWAIFTECYTTYGSFRKVTGYTWATIGDVYPRWDSWNAPWNSGTSTLLQPEVIAGNQQGFVILRGEGTGEEASLTINNISFAATITGITNALNAVIAAANTFIVGQQLLISGVAGMTQINGLTATIIAVTPTTITTNIDSTLFGVYVSGGIATPLGVIYSPNHGLNNNDYIIIKDAIGTISTQVNDKIFSVANATTDTFDLNPTLTSGTYLGLGVIVRMFVPYIQTKQFPAAWGMAKKTRIGVQRYLLTKTDTAQITLLIFLSQNNQSPYNEGPIVPTPRSLNDSLIYSTVLYTCPESTNLGLTPANINLNMVTATQQSQIWHRINTSLIGDTVQIGFTLNDAQMRELDEEGQPISQFDEIELHGMIIEVSPSMELA